MENPHFLTSLEEDQVIVTSEQHCLEPAVLFEMLGGTTLRLYNINNPKEENIYLAPVPEKEASRQAISELPASEAQLRLTDIITDFEKVCDHLRDVSERQLYALAEYARQRVRGANLYDAD